MSLASVGSKSCRRTPLYFRQQVRFAHRARDCGYLKKGLEIPSYRKSFENAVKQMHPFPQLMDRYFQTAAAATLKGKVPFVTAQAAFFRPYRIFHESLHPKEGFFRYLRQPSSQFNIEREALVQKIDSYVKKHGDTAWTPGMWNAHCCRLDTDPANKPFLVSLSYSMMDFWEKESAYYYLFANQSATRSEKMLKHLDQTVEFSLRVRGKQSKTSSILTELHKLSASYLNVKVGTPLVVSVPERSLKYFVYSSKSFGIPSKEDVAQVSKEPASSKWAFTDEEGGLQARLMIFKDTLSPNSGIDVIDLHSKQEVESYKKGHSIAASKDVPEYRDIFRCTQSAIELENAFKQEELDKQARLLALSV